MTVYHEYLNSKVETGSEPTEWNWKWSTLSVFTGYAAYFALFEVLYVLLKVVLGLEITGLHDFTFLLDDTDNTHMIVAVGTVEKFDYLTMKQYLNDKVELIDKCKSKLVKKFGLWFYVKMSEQEWKENLSKQFQLVQDIHTPLDLQKFAIK